MVLWYVSPTGHLHPLTLLHILLCIASHILAMELLYYRPSTSISPYRHGYQGSNTPTANNNNPVPRKVPTRLQITRSNKSSASMAGTQLYNYFSHGTHFWPHPRVMLLDLFSLFLCLNISIFIGGSVASEYSSDVLEPLPTSASIDRAIFHAMTGFDRVVLYVIVVYLSNGCKGFFILGEFWNRKPHQFFSQSLIARYWYTHNGYSLSLFLCS